MSRERSPYIYVDLDHFRQGDEPRFAPPVHHCPFCGRDWLCSDRYTQDFCSPLKQFPDTKNINCHPCMATDLLDDEDRAAWWETNGVSKNTD